MQILDRCTVDRDKVATRAAAGAEEEDGEEVKDDVEDGTVAGTVSSARASANSSFRLSSDVALAGLLLGNDDDDDEEDEEDDDDDGTIIGGRSSRNASNIPVIRLPQGEAAPLSEDEEYSGGVGDSSCDRENARNA